MAIKIINSLDEIHAIKDLDFNDTFLVAMTPEEVVLYQAENDLPDTMSGASGGDGQIYASVNPYNIDALIHEFENPDPIQEPLDFGPKFEKRCMKVLGVWQQFKANRYQKGTMLIDAFVWEKSEEGDAFWSDVNTKIAEFRHLIDEVYEINQVAAAWMTKGLFECFDTDIKICGDLADAFMWHKTPQGHYFWSDTIYMPLTGSKLF